MIKSLLSLVNPYLDWIKGVSAAVAVLAAIVGAVWYHHHVYQSGVNDTEAKYQKLAAEDAIKRGAVTVKADTEQIAKQSANTAKAQVITKEVIKYVKTPTRTVCKLDASFIRVFNASADGSVPTTASESISSK